MKKEIEMNNKQICYMRISNCPRSQQGVVMVISLVFLVALTAVAAALMQNTTTDVKMSGASEQKTVATHAAISAVDEVIFNQVAPTQVNLFARPIKGDNFPIVAQGDLLPLTNTGATAQVIVANNNFNLEPDCPHAKLASSTEVFTCNVLRVQVNRVYGRANNSNIQVNSNIAQQILK